MNSAAVGRGREGLFLHEVLDPVGDRLQQPARPDAVGAAAVLHPGADTLRSISVSSATPTMHDREDHQHLDDAEQEEALELRASSGALPRRRSAGSRAPRPVKPRSA